MNVLVTGSSGQLGSEIKEIYKKYSENKTFFFENSNTLDITNSSLVKSFFDKNDIDVVINCAAYTAVDKAESDGKLAYNVNVNGIDNLVSALKDQGKIIHISTDYVFNGANCIPYIESDKVDPIGVYGKTKRKGEEHIITSPKDGTVIRTSWLYSSYGNNFVKTMLRLGKEKESLGVIYDQIGSPTYARDLAMVCLELLDKDFKDKSKVYHYSNEGVLSWYDFAKHIMEIAEIDCKISPIDTKEYPTSAKRPSYSVLNKAQIKKDFNVEIPYWKDSLKECIKKLEN